MNRSEKWDWDRIESDHLSFWPGNLNFSFLEIKFRFSMYSSLFQSPPPYSKCNYPFLSASIQIGHLYWEWGWNILIFRINLHIIFSLYGNLSYTICYWHIKYCLISPTISALDTCKRCFTFIKETESEHLAFLKEQEDVIINNNISEITKSIVELKKLLVSNDGCRFSKYISRNSETYFFTKLLF